MKEGNKIFLIEYDMFFTSGYKLSGKIRVKNCFNDFHAKVKLEKYLMKKYLNFDRMIVHSCEIDVLSFFNDIFGNFDSNPFNYAKN